MRLLLIGDLDILNVDIAQKGTPVFASDSTRQKTRCLVRLKDEYN
jgi:hypothetical protein